LQKGVYSNAAGAITSAYEGIARFAETQGWHSIAGSAQTTAGTYSAGGWGAAGAAAMNIGAGMAGSYAGRKVFGNENSTGIGSTVGGLVGSIWGPVGTAIGSFIGEGLEAGIGKLTGHRMQNNNHGTSNFNTETDFVGQTGGHHDSTALNMNKDIFAMINTIADTFKSEMTGTIRSGNDGITLDGKKFASGQAIIDYAFDTIISNSTILSASMKDLILNFQGTTAEAANFGQMMMETLGPNAEISSTLKALIQKFKGTAEETGAFAATVGSFLEMIKKNPILDGFTDYTQKAESMNVVFDRQTQVVGKLIATYDGSLKSITELTEGYATMQQMAYEFAGAILAAGEAVRGLTTLTAEGFRQSIMTDAQLFASWTKERDGLAASLRTMTDPAQIQDTVSRITELSTLMYNSLPDAEKIAGASETYARYIENIGVIAQEQLNKVLGGLWVEMENMNSVAAAAMNSAANTMNGSVGSFSAHVTTFGNSVASLKAAVDELVRNGIPVRITNASRSEIGV
jgi:hypothetical protein